MKKMTIVASVLATTAALAGDHSMNLQGRMSWVSVDRDIKKTAKPSDSRIKAERADLTMAGKLSGNTTYSVGLNLAASSDSTDGKDGTKPFIDSVYVTRTLSEGLTLDIGKKGLLGGGFEVTHGAIDQYVSSKYWTTVDTTGNQFGLTLSKAFAGHTVMLQTSNGNKSRQVNSEDSQSRMGWAAEWLGTYSNGMIKSNVGYTVVPSATSKQSTNLLGAGLQFNLSNMLIEADYGIVTSVKALNSSSTDSKINSMMGLVAYTGMETLTPFAKFIVDTYKDANVAAHYGEKTQVKTTFGLGVEYKEAKADAIRYHAAYASSKYKYETVGGTSHGTDHTDTTMLVGAKIDVNIL